MGGDNQNRHFRYIYMTKPTKTDKKLDATDLAIQGIATAYPDSSLRDISDKLKNIKPLERTSVYRRLTKSEQLRENIDLVRQNNSEFLSRQLVPLALKETDKALKSKDLSSEQKFKHTKLVLDKEYGADDTKRPVQPIQVNIGQIQALIQQTIAKSD